MMKYFFYDTDYTGWAEYDIRGEDYKKLMRICCKHSSVLYLKYRCRNLSNTNPLKKFQISRPANVPADDGFYYPYCQHSYFRVCPELCDTLINNFGGIFEWIYNYKFHNPEDPVFYRSDGSIFFKSIIHDGICAIYPRETEDTEDLMNNVPWLTDEDELYPHHKHWFNSTEA